MGQDRVFVSMEGSRLDVVGLPVCFCMTGEGGGAFGQPRHARLPG